FSSRRRHTRLVSDWSSDVCSSDLGPIEIQPGRYSGRDQRHSEGRQAPTRRGCASDDAGHGQLLKVGADYRGLLVAVVAIVLKARSEERRVGKEGGARWGRER